MVTMSWAIFGLAQRRGRTNRGKESNSISPMPLSHSDHVFQAAKEPFRLSYPIPRPGEIISSAEFLRPYSDVEISDLWIVQFSRLPELITADAPTQEVWDSCIPPLFDRVD